MNKKMFVGQAMLAVLSCALLGGCSCRTERSESEIVTSVKQTAFESDSESKDITGEPGSFSDGSRESTAIEAFTGGGTSIEQAEGSDIARTENECPEEAETAEADAEELPGWVLPDPAQNETDEKERAEEAEVQAGRQSETQNGEKSEEIEEFDDVQLPILVD